MASSEGTRAVADIHSWSSTQRSQSSRRSSSALSSATSSAASLASLSTASSATSSTASSTTSSTASSATSSTVSPSPPAIDLSGHVLRLHIRGDMAVEEAAMPVDSGQYSTCWDLRTGQEDRTEHRDLPDTLTLDQRLLLGDGGPRRTREIMGVSELQLYPQEQPVEEQRAEGDSTPALGQVFSSTNPNMPDLIQMLGWNADRGPGEGQQRHGADRGPRDGEQGHGADRGPGNGQQGHGVVRLCVQCRVRRANVLTFNCHHRSLCQHCVDRVERCPWCHRPIVTFYRLDL